MDLTATKLEPMQAPRMHSFPRVSFYLQGAILLAVLVLLYARVVPPLIQEWFNDPNYSHGIFVPFCSLLLLWSTRKRWFAEPLAPSLIGLVLVLAAMGLLVVGTLGAELFLTRISLCVLIGGLIVYLAGWRMLRLVLAPWLFLFLMVPLPVIVFNQIAFPLQILASRLAASMIAWLHVPVLRDGNILILPTMSLNVVEACSGLRSLMSLITVAVFYSLFFEHRIWLRWLLILAAVPVAVCANALRIAISAALAEYVNPQLAEGFFHTFSGFLLFVLSLGVLAAVHWFGSRLDRERLAA
jgi:exosortase